MHTHLNYNLTTTAERLSHVRSINLSQLNPTELEVAATYILQYTDQQTKLTVSPTEPLVTATNIPDGAILPNYTHPRKPPNWESPELLHRYNTICALKTKLSQLNPNTDSTQIYTTKRLIRDLTIEGGWIVAVEPVPYAPIVYPAAIDLHDHIDLTNPFHIKHILKLYSQLKQSPDSWEFMEYFDTVCTRANLAPWQEHIITRQIDGASQITIGLELAQQFSRPITPSYLSQAKRTIYTTIAKTAHLLDLEFIHAHNPTMWRTCPNCNQTKLNISHNFYSKRKFCKTCYTKQPTKGGKNS